MTNHTRKRITIAALTVFCTAAATLAVWGDTQTMPRRLGILGWSDSASDKGARDGLIVELAKLGWIEGRNLAVNAVYANGDVTRMDVLAAELVATKPDVIAAANTPAALALQHATHTIHIVFSGVIDPVRSGLVKSLSRSGGNVTGVAGNAGYELIGKKFQLLKELLPRLTRIAVLYNPLESENGTLLEEHRRQAIQFGVRVVPVSVRSSADIDGAFAALQRSRPDAVTLLGNAVTITNREAICNRLTAARIPSTSGYTLIVEAGCLMGYLSLIDDFPKEHARYLDQILRGADPAELPVSQPSRYELVINTKVAKSLGLAIPQSLLLRVDRVIE